MPDRARAEEERDPNHPLPISRRTFLEKSAMAIAGGVLFSCTHHGRVVPRVTEDPAVTIDTRWPIKHVIYLMLENRSFDNIFGAFHGANGTKVGVSYGKEVPLRACPDWLPGDLPHDHAAALNDLNGGKLDGFAGGAYGPDWAYSQFTPQDVPHSIPNYWRWAKEYALSDRFFASALGPSYPNHFFFIAGQSGGAIDNPENAGRKTGHGGVFASWGCDAVQQPNNGVFVFVKDDKGNLSKHSPCFDFPTVGQQLTAHGLDWAFYSATPYQLGYYWNAYNGIGPVFHDGEMWHRHTRDVKDIERDIAANRLPPVTWVTPRWQFSDHPPSSSAFAHNWVTGVVNAVMKSPMWGTTAIFLTWDEWGGFYDHVMPPALDDVGLGFRVPLLTISPYAKRGYVDHELSEFSSPLKFISDNWGLPYLTKRIEKTSNLASLFAFTQRPRAPDPSPDVARTFGSAFSFPKHYPGWPKGTVPVVDPFGGSSR